MNKPTKSEHQQLVNNVKALRRAAESLDSIYRKMVINGRDHKYTEAARKASIQVDSAVAVLEKVLADGAETS